MIKLEINGCKCRIDTYTSADGQKSYRILSKKGDNGGCLSSVQSADVDVTVINEKLANEFAEYVKNSSTRMGTD